MARWGQWTLECICRVRRTHYCWGQEPIHALVYAVLPRLSSLEQWTFTFKCFSRPARRPLVCARTMLEIESLSWSPVFVPFYLCSYPPLQSFWVVLGSRGREVRPTSDDDRRMHAQRITTHSCFEEESSKGHSPRIKFGCYCLLCNFGAYVTERQRCHWSIWSGWSRETYWIKAQLCGFTEGEVKGFVLIFMSKIFWRRMFWASFISHLKLPPLTAEARSQ